MSTLATLERERNELLTEARDLAAKAESEGRGFTDEERETAADRLAKAREKNDEIQRFKAIAATREEVEALLDADSADELNDTALKGARLGAGRSRNSIGQRFAESEQYKGLMAAHGGHISETTKGITMPKVQIGGFKALITTGGTAVDGANVLVEPDRLGLVPFPTAPLSMRDLVTIGTTTSDKVEYAQVLPAGSGSTSAAKAVAEATATAGPSGTKPESTLKFRKASADVITVAHWLPATKRALSDAGQLRTLIDGFLRRGIAEEFERLMIEGDSDDPVGDEEFDGILNTTGVQSQAWAGSIPDTARKIITQVSRKGGRVTGFALSPEVNEALDLMVDNQGRYYGQGPFGVGPNTLWGRPRVEVHGLPSDKIVGGDFSTCVLWDREDTTLTATDSHADFFVRNLVAILAEARAAFGILNPQLLSVGEVVDPEAPAEPEE